MIGKGDYHQLTRDTVVVVVCRSGRKDLFCFLGVLHTRGLKELSKGLTPGKPEAGRQR